MTNNMDEFDPDLEPMAQPARGSGIRQNLATAWHTQPLIKLMAIMVVAALAIAGTLTVFSNSKPVETSNLVAPPVLNEPPGGKASQAFIEQNKMASDNRFNSAMERGGSAMPSPVGQVPDGGEENAAKDDPMKEFRAETERMRAEMQKERQQQQQQMQAMQQQVQQRPSEQFDDSLAQAMQRQMQQLTESWAAKNMKVVDGPALKDDVKAGTSGSGTTTAATNVSANANAVLPPQTAASVLKKALVPAGTVSYAQLLTEANSDVPGPILAQIVSGPLAGARAVGRFRTTEDYLVLEFNLATLKGKDYSINALALDPDTTLGGMATEVDHRYFTRLILPAAGSFVSTFGTTLGQGNSSTTATDGVIFQEQARRTTRDAIYSGIGQMGQTMQQFLQQEANNTKPLVRVAAGTPMGFFFLSSVQEDGSGSGGLMAGYPQGYLSPTGYAAMAGQNYGYATVQPGFSGAGTTGGAYGLVPTNNLQSGGLNSPYNNYNNGYNTNNSAYPTVIPTQQPLGNGNVTIISPSQQGGVYYSR